MKKVEAKKGFTIIEVVLVLAIAGLIFLMVFIALPALQRGQRDTQRRDDVARFMSQINSYQTNNNGNVPGDQAGLTAFGVNYLKINDGEFKDPQTGDNYTLTYGVANAAQPADTKTVYYSKNARCDGEGMVSSTASRSAAAKVKLEGSGFYCQDNQ